MTNINVKRIFSYQSLIVTKSPIFRSANSLELAYMKTSTKHRAKKGSRHHPWNKKIDRTKNCVRSQTPLLGDWRCQYFYQFPWDKQSTKKRRIAGTFDKTLDWVFFEWEVDQLLNVWDYFRGETPTLYQIFTSSVCPYIEVTNVEGTRAINSH